MPSAVGQLRIEFVAVTGQLNAQIADLEKRVNKAGKNIRNGISSGTSSIRDMSGALRTLEGGFDIRSLARFLSQSKELAAVARTLLPAIAGIAIVEMFGKMANAAYEFQKKMEAIPEKIRSGFDQMQSSQQETLDKIDVTNDKLEIQIAKFEHKPVNAMKLAVDETKEAADRLAISLQTDITKIDEMLSSNHISGLEQMKLIFVDIAEIVAKIGLLPLWTDFNQLFGSGDGSPITELKHILDKAKEDLKEGTTTLSDDLIHGQNKDITKKQNNVLNLSSQVDQAKAHGDTAKMQELQAKLITAQTDLNKTIRDDIKIRRDKADSLSDNGHALDKDNLSGSADVMERNLRINDAQNLNAAQEAKLAQIEADKSAHSALVEAIKQQWETAFKEFTSDGKKSAWDVFTYWANLASSTRDKVLKTYAYDKEMEAKGNANKKDEEEKGKDYEQLDKQQKIAEEIQKIQDEADKKHITALQEMSALQLKVDDKIAEIAEKGKDSLAEQAVSHQEATGQISKHTAAVDMANLHSQEFTETMQRLNDQLQAAQSLNDGTDEGKLRSAHAMSEIQEQMAQTQASRNVQQQADEATEAMTTQLGQAKDALAEWSQAAQDSGKKLAELLTETLGKLNDELLKMGGHQTSYERKKAFEDIGKQALSGIGKIGLEGVEGKALGALGVKHGKLGSNSSNPVWVKNVNDLGGNSGFMGQNGAQAGGGGLLSNLGILPNMPNVVGPGGDPGLPGGSSTSAASKSGGGILSTLFGIGKSFLGGGGFGGGGASSVSDSSLDDLSGLGAFADGGDPPVNQMSIVGEEGPELFVPKRAGTIIPNGKYGGGDSHYHDFRGANFSHTDPMMVQKQIMAAAPHIAAGAVKAISEKRARTAPSKNR